MGNLWEYGAWAHRMMKLMPRAARALENPRLLEIPVRKLRAAFPTATSKAGVPDRLLKAYLGHSSGDVLGGHYRRIDTEELRLVTGPIKALVEATLRKQSGNIQETATVNG